MSTSAVTNSICVYRPEHTGSNYFEITQLVGEGRVIDAWKFYRKICLEEAGAFRSWEAREKDRLDLELWVNLPPSVLIHAMVNELKTDENIIKIIPVALLRDCALAYDSFRERCFLEDALWFCFNGYNDYIADLAQAHPDFGSKILTSERHHSIQGDEYRLEIFRNSLPSLLKLIENNQLNEEKIKCLANYLLSYSLVIDKKDFAKIRILNQALLEKRNKYKPDSEEYDEYTSCLILMDLVEGKMSFQGIYQGQMGSCFQPPLEHSVINPQVVRGWMNDLSSKVLSLTDEDSILKGMTYLSSIPKESQHYDDARIMLGHIWLDLEQYQEAGNCFLEVAERTRSSEHLLLATMTLLAKVKVGDEWANIPRMELEKWKKINFNARTISIEECRSMTLADLQEALGN